MSVSTSISAMFGTALSSAMCLIFLHTAVHKCRNFGAFVQTATQYHILPAQIVRPAARLLLVAEIAIGIMLLTSAGRSSALAMAIILLLLFAVVMSINIRRGRTDIDCGCSIFGTTNEISVRLVLRNVLLAAICLIALSLVHDAAAPLIELNGITCGIILYVLYLGVDTLSGLPTPERRRGLSS